MKRKNSNYINEVLNKVQIFITLVLTVLVSFSVAGEETFSAKTDTETLFKFKKSIETDPNGVLSSWQLSKSTCTWQGVTCSSTGRVTGIFLNGSALTGAISFDALASLTMLSNLNLNSNSFYINSTSMLNLPYGLTQLDLSLAGLVGPLPENLFLRCPNLVYVNLGFNNMTGFLPEKFLFAARKLQFLDLSYNNFSGPITGMKIEAGSCDSLTEINFGNNRLSGSVPPAIRNCSNLRSIDVSTNLLDDKIPPEIGGLKSLQILDLSANQIIGSIPPEIGGVCVSLVELRLSGNNISGEIPETLSSCSWMKLLDLSNNNLSGSIPGKLFLGLKSLESVILSNNAVSGFFPESISSCKSLKVIDLSSNRISGKIPRDLCVGDSSLEELRMPDNLITGEIPAEISKCKGLKRIDLSLNYLSGSIPPEIGELESLEKLIAWFNSLEGKLPPELGNCRSLKDLILNNNRLSGEIPREIFLGCSDLEWLSLTSNLLSGEIPREFGLLTRLAVLQLGNNSFSGEIPGELANCSSLVWLDLNGNRLAGEIPPRLGRQQGSKALKGILSGNTLVFVRNVGSSCRGAGGLLEFAGIRPDRLLQVPNLKSCQFTRLYSGAVLSMFTQYQTLEYLDLSYNQLSGKIPEEFGDMIALQVMELAHNKLSGEIPWSLGKLKNLGVFDASHNRLQGQIPDSFSNLSFLVEIDLSDNELTGQIPTRGQLSTLPASQYADNPGLCGVPLPECQFQAAPVEALPRASPRGSSSWTNSVVLGVMISAASACVLVVWAIAMRARRREAEEAKMLTSLQAATTWKIEKEREPLSINVATFQRQLRKLKFSQLIEATDGFSAASLIGTGGFGEVFKATLKDGSSVAIKKLIRLSCQGDREFMAEMETLGKIKHKNLVPLLGYCKVGEERLLVYEFMDHGSLDEMLHGRSSSKLLRRRILSWEERKKIARGAAKGLCFLHHNCIPHIIHRDMKSSNVLLDREMEARVSDFGMARLISALDTHLSVSTLAGTPGYVPPEYYQSFRCTARGDVYSFGVILLEILTGKRPTDKEDFGDTNLVGWAKMKVREGKQMEVIDAELLAVAKGTDEADATEVKEMARYLEVTLRCVEDFPSRRPSMLQVVSMLRELIPGSPNGTSNSG